MAKYVKVRIVPESDEETLYFAIPDDDLDYALNETDDFVDTPVSDHFPGHIVEEVEEVTEVEFNKSKAWRYDWR